MSSNEPRTASRAAIHPVGAEVVLETIPDAFVAVDRQWRFAYVNGEAERLLDTPRGELLGEDLWQAFPDAAEPVYYAKYQLAFEAGQPLQFDQFCPSLGRCLEVRVYPSESHLTIHLHDITERRKAEESARGNRDRMDHLLQSVDVGLWYCDLPFDRLVWNEKTKDHFWLPPDEEVTIDIFFQRLHQEDRERTREAIQTAISDRTMFDTEYRTVSPDGRTKWIRAIGRGFYDPAGVAARFDGVTVDITAQEALVAEAQQSRAEAESLNGIGRALSAELDLEKLVQMVTNAATSLTGAQFGAFFYNVLDDRGESYMLYTIAGVPREAFDRFPMPRNTDVFAPTFRGEGVVRSDDITVDPRYGKIPPHHGMPAGHLPVRSYLAVPVVSRLGQVIGGLFLGHANPAVFKESHERFVIALASQTASAMDNAHLFTAVERAHLVAKDTAAALAKSNAELQRVAYVAAHDLQEPLRTIASFTQLLERRYRGAGAGAADDLVNGVVGSVRRMQALLNDLLEYTSLSSDEERPRGVVDMNALLLECLRELRPAMDAASAHLTAEPLPTVQPGNRAQLRLLLLHVLENAFKYARPGVPPEVSIGSTRVASVCTFFVRDNGQGFAREYRERIFEMFKRLHGRDTPGTGIGLALCRRIVEVHGGTISAESEPGRGTTIYFTLPCLNNPA